MQHWTREFSINELLGMVRLGHIALPDFQRDFVWEPSQVVDLIDSVSNGWPIGSLLVLEGPQPFNYRSIEDAPAVRREEISLYLLDGQQRVTALFQALTDRGDTAFFIDLTDESDDGLPAIKWERRTRFDRRPSSPVIFQISELMSDKVFRARSESLTSAELHRLASVREARLGPILRDEYRIPATVMGAGIELEALTRIFETLNRTGVKLNAFDLMVAVLRPADFMLRDEWDIAQDEFVVLRELGVDGLEILKLIALWQRDRERSGEVHRPTSQRVRGIRQNDVLNVPGDFVRDRWRDALEAYVGALNFLRTECGVAEAASMPSWAMVVTAGYLGAAGASAATIRRWYWLSIVSQTYAQGANTQVLTDVDRLGEVTPPPSIRGTLAAGLSDSSRRSRILRMGLRGLFISAGARDALSGERLSPPLEEFSVSGAYEGRLSRPADLRLMDLALANQSVYKNLRLDRGMRPSEEGLRSQGFASMTANADPEFDPTEPRVPLISALIESRL